jgi:hypothetical protein
MIQNILEKVAPIPKTLEKALGVRWGITLQAIPLFYIR